MNNKTNIIFNILFILYLLLILMNILSIYTTVVDIGFNKTLNYINPIYEIVIFILPVFLFLKRKIAIVISLFSELYWIITMPIFFFKKYGFYSIKVTFNFLLNGFYQSFFMTGISWLILIISFIGVILLLIEKHTKKNN